MFKTRLISGVILVIFAIVSLAIGGPVLFAVNLALALVGMFELYKAIDMQNTVFAIIGYAGTVVFYAILFGNSYDWFYIPTFSAIIAVLLAFFIFYVVKFPKHAVSEIINGFFVFLYVAVLLSYIYQTRVLTNGSWYVWLIVLSSWGCDTMAYCAGMMLGRHKLCPKLSPKKSVEGAIGGVIGSMILSGIFGAVMAGVKSMSYSLIWKFMVIAFAASIISQFGDLFASGIKREHDIKDYGNLIPGHGGVMDRFDSVLFVSPVIFYLTALILL